MKKFIIYISTLVFAFVTIARCDDAHFFDATTNSDEFVDPHSFYYDRTKKTMVKETDLEPMESLKKDNSEFQRDLKDTQMTYNQYNQEAIFYKRLINLLLANIETKVKDDELLLGTLTIEVSKSQMEYLQNFNPAKTRLREIDGILSSIIRAPKYNYFAEFMYSSEALFNLLAAGFKVIQQYRDEVMILFAMMVSFLAVRRVKWGMGIPIFLLVQIIFILSFFMTWWRLIQEAEIKLAAAQSKFSEVPITCRPYEMNMWQKLVSVVTSTGSDCEQYYNAIMSNPRLQITPAFALSHFVSTVLLHPISEFGTVVSGFISNATGDISWAYAWLVTIILYIAVGAAITILPFCLFGASFNIGLGPFFKFGIDCQKKSASDAVSNAENRERVQIILQQVPHITGTPTVNALEADQSNVQVLTKPEHCKAMSDISYDYKDSDDTSICDTVAYEKPSRISRRSKRCDDCQPASPKKEYGAGDC